jgi:nucleoside 2-deoxyribosyltransferase
MTNYSKMVTIKERLISMGNKVILPDPSTNEQLKKIISKGYVDTYKLKIKYDYIRKHYNHIVEADCIIIANYDKNKIKNYIGGNAFLEIGFAHILKKPIYLVNPVPKIRYYFHEIKAMNPIILNNQLSIFKSFKDKNSVAVRQQI